MMKKKKKDNNNKKIPCNWYITGSKTSGFQQGI